MNITIATGCFHSGWEMILPILQQAGSGPVGDAFARWHEELFQAAGADDPFGVRDPLQPGPDLERRAGALLPEASHASLLVAESRSVWTLDFWARSLPDARFLLFYLSAETALAHALLKGIDPSAFLDSWQATGRQMLRFQRHNRRRTLLLDAWAAVLNPKALVEVCGRDGHTLQVPSSGPVQIPSPPPVERMLAGWLAARPEVQSLQAELEASAIPLGKGESLALLKSDELLSDYLHRRKQAEVLTNACEEKMKMATDCTVQLEKAAQARMRLEDAQKDLTRENELLLLQLHQVQEKLETTFIQKQRLEREVETQQLRAARLKQTVSWRITAPLRTMAWPFSRASKEQKKKRAQVRLLKASGLFDSTWYRSAYPDVALSGMDPVEHYLLYGAAEGRNPSPQFDTQGYLRSNEDVAEAGMNPLVHFVKFGKAEGRVGY